MPPNIHALIGPLLLVLDLCGTFVFALSGGMTAVRHRLDIFGVIVVSFAAATSGGIIRDVLLGATPPASIRDWRYIAVSLLAGLVAFYFSTTLERWRSSVLILDAAGLSLFAVSGTLTALAFQLNPWAAMMFGVLTGIGGGLVRDILVSEVPTVLRAELYAVAALAGAIVVVIGTRLRISSTATALVGAGMCFTLRMIAIRRGWRLPAADEVRHWHARARAAVRKGNEGPRGGSV